MRLCHSEQVSMLWQLVRGARTDKERPRAPWNPERSYLERGSDDDRTQVEDPAGRSGTPQGLTPGLFLA